MKEYQVEYDSLLINKRFSCNMTAFHFFPAATCTTAGKCNRLHLQTYTIPFYFSGTKLSKIQISKYFFAFSSSPGVLMVHATAVL